MLKPSSQLVLPVAISFAISIFFWWPLFTGAGFIGGDLYPYFFPQKAFYADHLKAGVFPLWNDLTGFGYPVLGESQTGAAYPFHLVFYYLFDLNTAYNIEHILHYTICFAGTFLLARRLGLSTAGGLLSAVVFTYGWFPPRACLEWAVLTGAWMPVALWCVESFLQTGFWRYAIGLSVALGLQLLAGHFHLAFITLLLVTTYPVARLLAYRSSQVDFANQTSSICRKRVTVGLIMAIIAGAGLACVQLLPTWELKQRSTRIIQGGEYDPAYGHMPPLYVSQVILPWKWYNLLEVGEDSLLRDLAEFVAPWHWFGPRVDAEKPNEAYDLDRALQQARWGSLAVGTNKVEAHFYCGMIPVCLAIWLVVRWLGGKSKRRSLASSDSLLQLTIGYWLIVGLFALLYATGILMPIGRHIPGFSFFRGPGRYGIVPSLAIALFAGQMLSNLLARMTSKTACISLMAFVFASTCGDLWLVSRMVRYTVMVRPPRIAFREASEVRRTLREEPAMPRLLAPMPNIGNLLGVSCVPWYLGIAPAEYVDPQNAMPPLPKPPENHKPTVATPAIIEWLSRSGVTHILNEGPLDELSWKVELIWHGFDQLVNRVMAREEPLFLYRFRKSDSSTIPSFPGRAYTGTDQRQVPMNNWQSQTPNERKIELADVPTGESQLILTELAYPGWKVQQGGKSLTPKREGMFRAVDLTESRDPIEWIYRPQSVYVGAAISLISAFLLAAIAHMRFWHPKRVAAWIDRLFPPKPVKS